MADGAVTADVLVPLIAPFDQGVNNAIFDLTISASQTLLGTTTFYSGEGSSVGLIAIAGRPWPSRTNGYPPVRGLELRPKRRARCSITRIDGSARSTVAAAPSPSTTSLMES